MKRDRKVQGICLKCGINKQVSSGYGNYRKYCTSCHSPSKQYRQHKKGYCEQCKFIPVHPCQLDVDHIDGNHKNNDSNNLQTLCANCHRLKTKLFYDNNPSKNV